MAENSNSIQGLTNLPFQLDRLSCPKPNEHLKKVYLSLLNTVKNSISAVDPDQIRANIQTIINEFENSPYNDLLFFTYSMSEQNYVPIHIANNVILSIAFASSLRLSNDDLLDLGIIAFCHDFGMIEYTNIFQLPNELNKEQRHLIQKHPQKSAEKFKNVFNSKIIDAIFEIHETVDGRGYPLKKSALEISIFAKIISICDVFASLTHSRNFRNGFSSYEAIKMIVKRKNMMFDERLVKKFIEFTGIYPFGSFVLLNTGQTALVVASNPASPTRGIIKILLMPNNKIDPTFKIVNLLNEQLIYITEALDKTKKDQVLQILGFKGMFIDEK